MVSTRYQCQCQCQCQWYLLLQDKEKIVYTVKTLCFLCRSPHGTLEQRLHVFCHSSSACAGMRVSVEGCGLLAAEEGTSWSHQGPLILECILLLFPDLPQQGFPRQARLQGRTESMSPCQPSGFTHAQFSSDLRGNTAMLVNSC